MTPPAARPSASRSAVSVRSAGPTGSDCPLHLAPWVVELVAAVGKGERSLDPVQQRLPGLRVFQRLRGDHRELLQRPPQLGAGGHDDRDVAGPDEPASRRPAFRSSSAKLMVILPSAAYSAAVKYL